MAKLTYEKRKELPRGAFVYPATRRYPIENEAHARNALSRVSRFGTRTEKKRVRRAVMKKYPWIGRSREERRMAD